VPGGVNPRLRLSRNASTSATAAYYEARKLTNPPGSLYDYNDAKRGLEPPAERRARQQRDNRRPAKPPSHQTNVSPFRQNATATHFKPELRQLHLGSATQRPISLSEVSRRFMH